MVATPAVPGAINVAAPLSGNEIVAIATGGPQSAQTTTGAIAALASTFDNSFVSNITAAVGTTYTAAQMLSGLIARTGPTAAFTDMSPTAALLAAAINPVAYPTSFYIDIQNFTNFTLTMTGGTGITVAANTVIPPNSVGEFLVTLSAATAGTMYRIFSGLLSDVPTPSILALSTVGAGTITAAGIVGGVTNRTGSTAAFTDTTDTAANIILALPNPQISISQFYTYYNNTPGLATITGGTGVTVTGGLVAANSWTQFVFTYTAAATITMVAIEAGPNVQLPPSKYSNGSAATFAAGSLTGANVVNYENTGSNATLTVRTAAQMFGDIPNCQIGFSYQLYIRNTNATGATITADGGGTVTLTGTMTIAQNVTRMFNVVFPSATTCTIQSMGISAAAA